MKPYDGMEVWMYFVLAILAVLSLVVIFYAFKVEKMEKAEKALENDDVAKKLRYKKYGIFGLFFVIIAGLIVSAMSFSPMSKDNFHESIVSHIESNNVKIVEGFVNSSTPLTAGNQAKFVVETENGLVRCRANAPENGDNIEFVCQDTALEDKPFSIPLENVNK